MKRTRKSNRVSWASGGNLCQVKLFLSEDFPSKVGLVSHDNLEAKTSSLLCSSTNDSIDLPPGFESSHFLNQSKVEFSHIPKIKWECPLPFVFNSRWLVAAGEESREKDVQKLREIRVLEAVYPRLSAIPPSPSVSLDVEEEEDYDGSITPLIPIIPIEEEEESMANSPKLEAAVNLHPYVQSPNLYQYTSATTSINSDRNASGTVSPAAGLSPFAGVSSGLEADVVAASDAVAAILKSNEHGGLIDMDLLVKIFSDPKMIENLINEASNVGASSNAVSLPTSGSKSTIPSSPFFTPTPDMSASRNTHISSVGFSGLNPPSPSVSSLNPTSGKPATLFAPSIPSYSTVTSPHDRSATASVPFSRPVLSGQQPVSPSVFVPTPTSAPHMPRPVDNNFHMSSGMPTALNSQPQPNSFLASGAKRSASFAFASMSSSELNTAPLPPPTGNLHTVFNHGQTTARTKPYQTSTGSASAVKDANYYKNLIRQHGADGQDKPDPQIGNRHSNFQDMKLGLNNQGEVKHKSKKPCIYFNSQRGCRNGASCPFQHDVSAQSGGAGNFLGLKNANSFKM